MTKPTISEFTGTENLGVIFREQNKIQVKLLGGKLPLSGTSGNVELNLGGKLRTIILQGASDGTGFVGIPDTAEQRLSNFIYRMEEWVNNGTQTLRVYIDSFGEEYNVHAVDWTWIRSFSDPNRILYTLMMREAWVAP